MREIKFRAWNPESEIMYDAKTLIEFMMLSRQEMFLRKLIWLQYTGLKDKNGKEIYEGDYYQRYNYLYKVYWDEKSLGFKGKLIARKDGFTKKWGKYSDKKTAYVIVLDDLTEIIGNIYKNKDLLTK